jgi:hypothetical protein
MGHVTIPRDPAAASLLPTVKHVLSVIGRPDESSLYQGVKVTNLSQGKTLGRLIKDNSDL